MRKGRPKLTVHLKDNQAEVLVEIARARKALREEKPPIPLSKRPADIKNATEAEDHWWKTLHPRLQEYNKLHAKAIRIGLRDHPLVREWILAARRFGDKQALRRARCGLEKGVKGPDLIDAIVLEGLRLGRSLGQTRNVLLRNGFDLGREAFRKRGNAILKRLEKATSRETKLLSQAQVRDRLLRPNPRAKRFLASLKPIR